MPAIITMSSTRASTAACAPRSAGRCATASSCWSLTLVTFATSLWAFQFIPQNFFPQSSRPEILVDLWLPEGTSIKEVETQAKALEAKMMDDKDKKFIATYIGEGAPRFFLPLDQQLRNPNFAQLLVMANDEPARERLIVKLRTILAQDFPSIRSKVDRLFLGPPTGWPVQMRVMGPDRQEVRRIADEVKAKFARPIRSSAPSTTTGWSRCRR